jgi:recombination protein RecT
MGKSTQLQVIGHYLQSKVDRIGELMPSNAGITAQRLVRVTLMAINDNPRLLQCTPESVYAALLESARLGLEIGGALPQGYLVPYGKKAVFQLGYRGLIDLVLRSGNVKRVHVEFVHVGDVFHREMGIDGRWQHVASNDVNREDQPITHVYSEFKMSDGETQRYAMTKAEIDKHGQQFSQSWGDADGPWQQHWKAMAAKTVIRQPIQHGLIPIRLSDVERRHVIPEPSTSGSLRELAAAFGEQEIPCDTEGEIVCEISDEEKAQILAQEAAGE